MYIRRWLYLWLYVGYRLLSIGDGLLHLGYRLSFSHRLRFWLDIGYGLCLGLCVCHRLRVSNRLLCLDYGLCVRDRLLCLDYGLCVRYRLLSIGDGPLHLGYRLSFSHRLRLGLRVYYRLRATATLHTRYRRCVRYKTARLYGLRVGSDGRRIGAGA